MTHINFNRTHKFLNYVYCKLGPKTHPHTDLFYKDCTVLSTALSIKCDTGLVLLVCLVVSFPRENLTAARLLSDI